MKASELIGDLATMISVYGDREVITLEMDEIVEVIISDDDLDQEHTQDVAANEERYRAPFRILERSRE